MSSNSETVFETFWLFPENTGFCMLKKHKYPFIYWEMWSGMCTNHQSCSSSAFCSIRLFQALVSLILKYWNNYRILDHVTLCDHRFSRFQYKVAQGISRLRFQLCITFVPDYRFKWNKRLTKLWSLVIIVPSKFVSKLPFIVLNFARKDCKVLIGTSCTVRPLFKKFTQHCETYEPTNCCVKKLHNLCKIVHNLCKIVHKLCNFFTQLLVGSYVSQCCVKF